MKCHRCAPFTADDLQLDSCHGPLAPWPNPPPGLRPHPLPGPLHSLSLGPALFFQAPLPLLACSPVSNLASVASRLRRWTATCAGYTLPQTTTPAPLCRRLVTAATSLQ